MSYFSTSRSDDRLASDNAAVRPRLSLSDILAEHNAVRPHPIVAEVVVPERHQPQLRYYVVQRSAQWHISFEDKAYGPYRTQALAIRAAVDAAHCAGIHGRLAQVLVHGLDAQWRTEKTFGRDPDPPSA